MKVDPNKMATNIPFLMAVSASLIACTMVAVRLLSPWVDLDLPESSPQYVGGLLSLVERIC